MSGELGSWTAPRSNIGRVAVVRPHFVGVTSIGCFLARPHRPPWKDCTHLDPAGVYANSSGCSGHRASSERAQRCIRFFRRASNAPVWQSWMHYVAAVRILFDSRKRISLGAWRCGVSDVNGSSSIPAARGTNSRGRAAADEELRLDLAQVNQLAQATTYTPAVAVAESPRVSSLNPGLDQIGDRAAAIGGFILEVSLDRAVAKALALVVRGGVGGTRQSGRFPGGRVAQPGPGTATGQSRTAG